MGACPHVSTWLEGERELQRMAAGLGQVKVHMSRILTGFWGGILPVSGGFDPSSRGFNSLLEGILTGFKADLTGVGPASGWGVDRFLGVI